MSKSTAFWTNTLEDFAIIGEPDRVHIDIELVDVVPTAHFSVNVFSDVVLINILLNVQDHVSKSRDPVLASFEVE